ncbi:MAG: hypothetical protein DRQ97_11300 [Gammaproteobacteria bacterium]|nr:MAG: hypothetical protein DRQ97_11300 [Gammaproteobacteria bacterium]
MSAPLEKRLDRDAGQSGLRSAAGGVGGFSVRARPAGFEVEFKVAIKNKIVAIIVDGIARSRIWFHRSGEEFHGKHVSNRGSDVKVGA